MEHLEIITFKYKILNVFMKFSCLHKVTKVKYTTSHVFMDIFKYKKFSVYGPGPNNVFINGTYTKE